MAAAADHVVHLALLIPITGVFLSGAGGNRIIGAAPLAIARVHADKTLLPGRVLEYRWADSGCSAAKGLTAMGKVLG